ncbi:MAG: cupin domain-containing protein, partial [Acidobacteria bacterium]|nr:cupin domain-containing protein [Acidobacteriota bacterium]
MEDEKKPGQRQEALAAPARLKDLVAYQDGAVVSRTLLDHKAGTVTLFAFDAGQG